MYFIFHLFHFIFYICVYLIVGLFSFSSYSSKIETRNRYNKSSVIRPTLVPFASADTVVVKCCK